MLSKKLNLAGKICVFYLYWPGDTCDAYALLSFVWFGLM